MIIKSIPFIAAFGLIFGATSVLASPSHSHGTDGIGHPGDPQRVDRTLEVRMGENYYEPKAMSFKPGETVRFVLKNEGVLLHEFSLGKAAAHVAHQKEMAAMFQHGMLSLTGAHDMSKMGHGAGDETMADMVHDDPNSVLLDPGAHGELIWTFSEPTELEFACNVPGHYQSGMVGKLTVR